jgi:hypothetical protein
MKTREGGKSGIRKKLAGSVHTAGLLRSESDLAEPMSL